MTVFNNIIDIFSVNDLRLPYIRSLENKPTYKKNATKAF